MCSVERYHHLCRVHSPMSARASVVCLATIIHGIRGTLRTVPELNSHSPVLIMEIDMFREAPQNVADLVDFHKRRLCVDTIVVSTMDPGES
jgi:NDP-sugar pyrophosphorylase family protein